MIGSEGCDKPAQPQTKEGRRRIGKNDEAEEDCENCRGTGANADKTKEKAKTFYRTAEVQAKNKLKERDKAAKRGEKGRKGQSAPAKRRCRRPMKGRRGGLHASPFRKSRGPPVRQEVKNR